ncbi:hypothetical protein DEO72_LG9g3530 [Vigna unguiculata]|uniref:Uncharacterized protein n=1 Tax=Vigna unguiculata TaxID=3917 RepID=A0A4D6N6K3_VIGUN|nr:hypothetical protein DEO72_LG9g3530 [Vigna unguiculata]
MDGCNKRKKKNKKRTWELSHTIVRIWNPSYREKICIGKVIVDESGPSSHRQGHAAGTHASFSKSSRCTL